MTNISEILNQIPIILEYFIPGFVFLTLFNFFTSRKSEKYQLITSVVISYIIKSSLSILHTVMLTHVIFRTSEKVIILVINSIVTAILLSVVYKSKWLQHILIKIGNNTVHDNIWIDVLDQNDGSIVRVDLGDTVYFGVVELHDNDKNYPWFILKNCCIKKADQDNLEEKPCGTRIAINILNAKSIEIYPNTRETDRAETFNCCNSESKK